LFFSFIFSSKGKPQINHDEPVAFFATEEDWYVELEMSAMFLKRRKLSIGF